MDDFDILRKLAMCENKEQMQRCIDDYNESQKPMTNADRIRTMSDRELADFLSTKFSEVCCLEHELSKIQMDVLKHNLVGVFMNWLKQPAEVE